MSIQDKQHEKRRVTQVWLVREHLRSGAKINPLEALRSYGIMRLAAVILLLRNEGMDIKTTMVHDNGKRWASYTQNYSKDVLN